MTEEEDLVYEALLLSRPVLGDLFSRGVELANEPDRPGQVHLIAYIGREISNSFLQLVAAELPSHQPFVPPHVLADLNDDRENMRLKIGRAFGLAPHHPVVGAWFGVHRALDTRAHVPRDGLARSSADVIVAFRRLTKLLWSRLAPYFAADDELVALLASPPEATAMETLHALFLRPQIRGRFFALCSSPEWVEFLDNAGFFSHAPEIDEASGMVAVQWPEGTALMNVAAAAPDLVVRIILRRIPRDSRNPAVVDRALRAIELLPVEFLPSVLGHLTDFIALGIARYAGPAGLSVAAKLAATAHPSAIEVVAAMLRLRPLEPVDRTKPYRSISPPTYDLLEAVDDYYVERLLESVVPVLASHHPIALAECLATRLCRAEALLAQAGYTDGPFSHHWLSHWSHSTRARDDLRADLARALDGVAQQALVDNPADFPVFDSIVRNHTSDLMLRLRLRFMIAAGPAGAAEHIDEVIASDWIVDPDCGARETAELLRRHFTTAGYTSKAVFVRRVEAGPDEEVLRAYCERRGLDASDQDARLEGAKSWQEMRLRWFHERLPGELHSLAARIEFAPHALDRQRQDLDEVGHWSSGAVWSGDGSPLSVEELRALSDEEIIGFLEDWEPTEAQRFDGPNRQGLADRLRQLIAEDIHSRGGLLRYLAANPDLDPGYRGSALSACVGLVKESLGDDFPWEESLLLVRVAVEAEPDGPSGHRPRLWARREALRLLRDSCNASSLPAIHAPTLVDLVGLSVATASRWASLGDQEVSSFESIGMMALNYDAGVVVDLIVSACRFLKQLDDHTLAEVDALVAGWLDEAVGWEGPNAAGARWQLGHHLPALLHFADSWVQANEVDLLGEGMTDPLSAPTWGAFLLSYGVHDNVFCRLGRWYRLHASQVRTLQEWEATTGNQRDDQRLSRHFVEHAGMALLRGLITFDSEEDEDFRQVLVQSAGDDRAHFAWLVMRALDDVDGPLQEGFTDRLIRYWAWRLDAIGSRQDPEDAKELDALGWFIRIEQLAPGATIDLALQTIEGASTTLEVRGHVWQALPRFVLLDPVKAVRMVEALVAATLAGEYAYVDFSEVAPVLTSILASGDTEARVRAIGVVHRLGEAGWSEFRQLLS